MELTFGQSIGVEPLPEQARLGFISDATRAALWFVIHEWLAENSHYTEVDPEALSLLKTWWVVQQHQMIDYAPRTTSEWRERLGAEMRGHFPAPYNLVQFLLRSNFHDKDVFAEILEHTHAAYRVVGETIVPFASPEQHAELQRAFDAASSQRGQGVRTHLANAGSALTDGKWASAISESLAAAEAAGRLACGDHSLVLPDAIRLLRKQGRIDHPALTEGLVKLYAYGSDKDGIRHSLTLKADADVTEKEAFLLFGLCASFVTFLLSLSR